MHYGSMEAMPRVYTKRAPEDRFWEKTEPRPCRYPDIGDCLIWTGAVDKNGYGLFQIESRRTIRAHRWAHESATGETPKYVLHACDTPPCVNPLHLSSGTARQNSADRDSRGRGASGERHYAAKLSDEQVAEMRTRHAAGESAYALHKAYAISYSQAKAIIAGRKRRSPASSG